MILEWKKKIISSTKRSGEGFFPRLKMVDISDGLTLTTHCTNDTPEDRVKKKVDTIISEWPIVLV